MPFKQWVSGELVTAADANTYWGEQAVLTFADATARDVAITTPVTGMHAWLTGSSQMTVWTGSQWANTAAAALTETDVFSGVSNWNGPIQAVRQGGLVTLNLRAQRLSLTMNADQDYTITTIAATWLRPQNIKYDVVADNQTYSGDTRVSIASDGNIVLRTKTAKNANTLFFGTVTYAGQGVMPV